MEFGGSPGALVSVGRSAWLQFGVQPYSYKVSGSSPGDPEWIGAFCYSFSGGNIGDGTLNAPTLTITTPISVQQGWIVASISASAQQYMAFAGAANVSGPKFFASLNGVIDSSGSGVSFYPGNVAGTLQTGGQYA
jgi:hypothetical protein